ANYFGGQVVTTYLGTTQDVGVRLWAHPPGGEKIYRSDVANLPLRSPDGHMFTLGTVAKVEFVGGQPELNRENLAQIVPVTAVINGTHDLGSEYKQQQMAVNGMVKVGTAAVLAEIILLLFLYERFSIPIIIIVSSLISTGAVFIGLWMTGIELNITAMMGMVMIIGISTEMSIFLFSEYQMLEESMPPHQAIFEAALNRLRPIVMSTLAMILALLPLGAAVSGSGDQMLQPLAIAIIAGSIVQLPLVLLAMPVLVGLLVRKRERAPAMNLLRAGGRRTRPGAAE